MSKWTREGEAGEVRDVFDVNHGRRMACGRIAVPSHAPKWQPLTARGGGGEQRAGELCHTPHTRLVLRGTENRPDCAKIRAYSTGR